MSGWGNPVPKPSKPPATVEAPSIDAIFARMVADVRRQIPDDQTVVDVECAFKRVTVEKSGLILALFNGDQTESSMEIKLATRVRRSET